MSSYHIQYPQCLLMTPRLSFWTLTSIGKLKSSWNLEMKLNVCRVEVIGQNPVEKTENIKETNTETYSMNHTMVRVKNVEDSLKFYQEVMGMTLLRTSENKDAGFNLYFLGYGSPPSGETANGVNPTAKREGLLELTWNYGSEKEEGPVYTDGNKEPQGEYFGVIQKQFQLDQATDNLMCRFRSHCCGSGQPPSCLQAVRRSRCNMAETSRGWSHGKFFFFRFFFFVLQTLTKAQKTVAFVKDPTGYWIEVIGQGMKD